MGRNREGRELMDRGPFRRRIRRLVRLAIIRRGKVRGGKRR
jgi:hypothetical protein